MAATQKALLCGLYSAILNRYYVGERDLTNSALFGATVAGAQYASFLLHPAFQRIYLPTLNKELYDSRVVIERGVEIGMSFGLFSLLNNYGLLQSVEFTDERIKTLGVIFLADWRHRIPWIIWLARNRLSWASWETRAPNFNSQDILL
jgi:hypothetical protein